MFENIHMIRVDVDTISVRTKRLGCMRSHDHGHGIQESQRSVLTNQCLGKGMNAEPPGRGTEESCPTNSDEFIVERP
jgi:hypothetical protein